MKILSIHNHYRIPGGEDTVARIEADLLRAYGENVVEYRRSNHEIEAYDTCEYGMFPWRAIWSHRTYRELVNVIKKEKPDVAHFHNTFFVISPSAYYACRDMNVPVVQTLHNFRLMCPRADFFRNNGVCEDCLGKTIPWPGVFHACYYGSRSHTALVSSIVGVHRFRKTWNQAIDAYIALLPFARRKFVQAGIPKEKIFIKPNAIFPDPGIKTGEGEYALFIGRLSPEERINFLLKSWLTIKGVPLKLVGPQVNQINIEKITKLNCEENIECLGERPHSDVIRLIKGARFLIVPSAWYETFPMVILEAFACGVPVIATRIGAMQELIENGLTGLLFPLGDVEAFREKVNWAWEHPRAMETMGREARQYFEKHLAAQPNYESLMNIYRRVIGAH